MRVLLLIVLDDRATDPLLRVVTDSVTKDTDAAPATVRALENLRATTKLDVPADPLRSVADSTSKRADPAPAPLVTDAVPKHTDTAPPTLASMSATIQQTIETIQQRISESSGLTRDCVVFHFAAAILSRMVADSAKRIDSAPSPATSPSTAPAAKPTCTLDDTSCDPWNLLGASVQLPYEFKVNDMLRSLDGTFHAVLQQDGNFVVYQASKSSEFKPKNARFSTDSWKAGPSATLRFAADGTAELKDRRGKSYWKLEAHEVPARTDEKSQHPLELKLSNTGELVIHGRTNAGRDEVLRKIGTGFWF